ncbi:hypothetical protein NLJ89_g4604 [Agrocybe chaxingu]|uniref:Sm domain-containing protein n=1 Tax=Agrocybe chaxingu TaxID=84603 RepID=A0A9W8K1T0_9AGAR|nr:hypothetical protein NLJ89_g4604 [Agrocybe chaxingu]
MLPLSLLTAAQNKPMLVELKNGETLNGHLVNCDNFMNITLREVYQTNPDGDRFWKLKECYIRGSTIKYLRVPDNLLDIVKEEQNRARDANRSARGGHMGGEPQEPVEDAERQCGEEGVVDEEHDENVETAKMSSSMNSGDILGVIEPQESTGPKRDGSYYLEGGLVVLKLDDIFFRVPQYQLARHSEILHDLFQVPQSQSGGNQEGASDELPIIFAGTTADDFRNFLKALLPFSPWRQLSLTKAEWISTLKLATMWYCLDLRQVAIAELMPMLNEPIEKILLGRKYSVLNWVFEGYRDMVLRNETITDNEAVALLYPEAVKLLRMREWYWRSPIRSQRYPSSQTENEVNREFEEELISLRQAEYGYGATQGSFASDRPSTVQTQEL